MNEVSETKKIAEGAYFVIDTTSYTGQITPFDLRVATQTISPSTNEQIDSIEPVNPLPIE